MNGFSALEVLLVLVVVAIIGVAGYFVWQRQHHDGKETAKTVATKTETEESIRPTHLTADVIVDTSQQNVIKCAQKVKGNTGATLGSDPNSTQIDFEHIICVDLYDGGYTRTLRSTALPEIAAASGELHPARWSDFPVELQRAIESKGVYFDSGRVDPADYYSKEGGAWYSPQGFAITFSGAIELWSKSTGSWKHAFSTQSSQVACDIVTKERLPLVVFDKLNSAHICVDTNNVERYVVVAK
jgi:prepilin-type N-terminal cleavage/methylation domain-containing protein